MNVRVGVLESLEVYRIRATSQWHSISHNILNISLLKDGIQLLLGKQLTFYKLKFTN